MKQSYLRAAVKAALLIPAVAGLSMKTIAQTIAQEVAADDDMEVIQVRGLISSVKRSFLDKKKALIALFAEQEART
jgi:iron complex outermembrane receptor protein